MTAGRLVVVMRFPVKSMAGERLESVAVQPSGLTGDRAWAVCDEAGRLASGKQTSRFRRMDPVLALAARTVGEEVLIRLPDGREVVAGESAADLALSEHLGEDVELIPGAGEEHQDAGAVSLVGTATLRELGALLGQAGPVDARHLRANLVVETDEAFVEESWVGREVSVGSVRLEVTERVERCRMVDVAQADVPAQDGLLRLLGARRGVCAGVYARVVQPGRLAVGTRSPSEVPAGRAAPGPGTRGSPGAGAGYPADVPTLHEVLSTATDLAPAETEWLHLLIGDWQLLSDLSFADLVLWVPGGLEGWLAVAHVRPTTGQMVFFEDVVGRRSHRGRHGLLDQAYAERRTVRAKEPTFRDDMPVREEAIPVVRQGRALAVITRHTNLAAMRTPSRLELTYQALADALCRMIAAGEFPHASAPTGMRRGAPRVGDGVIRLDVDGVVSYASPNALSAIHRLGHVGDVIGELLAKVVADLLRDESPVDESLALVVTGRAPWRTEVSTRGASVAMRAIPLTEAGQRTGALLLLRDVSELRRREQELLTKEATIREIHHRVKNNLQTVAALLRLQARRLPEGEGRFALEEAVRRVGVIALVHETLSQGFEETVNFDEIAARGLAAVIEVARVDHPITSTITGSFGHLRAEDTTALAMVISELVQNAVEHGLAERGGSIEIAVQRSGEAGQEVLEVTITDDGAGLPPGFRPGASGLGTQIVQSLVQDLRGRITWEPAQPHGTRVRFIARLRALKRDRTRG